METFQIEIDNVIYNITFRKDRTYTVETINGDTFIIESDLDDSGVIWRLLKGNASQYLINELGNRIEKYYL